MTVTDMYQRTNQRGRSGGNAADSWSKLTEWWLYR
jgi:hypothetical protein